MCNLHCELQNKLGLIVNELKGNSTTDCSAELKEDMEHLRHEVLKLASHPFEDWQSRLNDLCRRLQSLEWEISWSRSIKNPDTKIGEAPKLSPGSRSPSLGRSPTVATGSLSPTRAGSSQVSYGGYAQSHGAPLMAAAGGGYGFTQVSHLT